MNKKFYIGWDNGITGSIGCVERNEGFQFFIKTPIFEDLKYTKTKGKIIKRVNYQEIMILFDKLQQEGDIFVLVERPMVNPINFNASLAAVRVHEAQMMILESMGIPFEYTDSKPWQSEMLPAGIKGSDELKKASKIIGKRLFPMIDLKHPDCDGILMAEYAKRSNF